MFSDNFDTDGLALNQSTFSSGWTVTDGTVDVIGAVGFFDLMEGNGRYVDLDGSSGQPGLFSNTWQLTAGVTYRASFDLAGNQRKGGDDLVNVMFGTQSAKYVLGQDDMFGHRTLSFTPSANGLYSLSFLNDGHDNLGALLDNVTIDALRPALRATVDIPEPASAALFFAGMLGFGLAKRNRRAGKAPL